MKSPVVPSLALALGILLAAPAGAHAVTAPAADSTATLPTALQPAFYAALADTATHSHALDAQGCATLASQALAGCFSARGAAFRDANGLAVDLHLVDWGRGDDRHAATPTAPRIDANAAHYAFGAVTEWWKVLPLGFEQGFTFNERPAGAGEISLQLAASSDVQAAGDALGWGDLRYGKLVVTDADGRVLPARLDHRGAQVLIAFEDHGARYPVTVDPLVWVEQKVTASDGALGDKFGYSVALDGDTALIGATKASGPAGQQGAAWVFTHDGSGWNQAARLLADDGAAGNEFGYSVALADGRALVGARGVDGNRGAVYAFEGSGASWAQTGKLLASDGLAEDRFGSVVAMAGDAALVSAATASVNGNAMQGAGYIFRYTGGTWTEQAKLVASDGVGNDQAGISAAFDGTTAVLGTPNPGFFIGAAYVFAEVGGSWTETAKLVPAGAGPFTAFGSAVAVQGTNLLVGGNLAFGAAPSSGAAWMYTYTGGAWTLQQQLLAADAAPGDDFGYAVLLDGDSAVVGADRAGGELGAVYIFTQSGGSWSQTDKLMAADASGGSIYGGAIAKQGNTLLTGANGADAAYFYTATSVVTDPVAVVAPAVLDLAVASGGSVADVLGIANQGGSELTYAIATAAGGNGACATPAPIDWLQLPLTAGSAAPGQSKTVSVVVDGHALSAGSYTATLCVTTNDPQQALIAVPVNLTVTAADALFCSGFEDGDTGACADSSVVTGQVDQDVVADDNGNTLDLVTGLWSTYDGGRVDDINLYQTDDTLTAYFYGDVVTNLPVGGVVDANGQVAVLAPGTIVGPGSVISPGSGYLNAWTGGADGYLGIAFRNEQTGQLNYGYIHLTTSAPLGFPARVLEYAYDKTGAAIRIPD